MSESIFFPGMENARDETGERELIRILKEKGVDDPVAKQALINWTITGEKEADKSSDPEARIKFELKRARLYYAAGFLEAAKDSFEAALTQAWNERRDGLCEEIKEEIDKLGL